MYVFFTSVVIDTLARMDAYSFFKKQVFSDFTTFKICALIA